MTPKLAVDLAPGQKNSLLIKNPVMPASGTFSWGLEFAKHFDIEALGAVVSKGVTMAVRGGNPQSRVAQTPAGMLNSIGLQNIGIDHCISDMAPLWARWNVPVIVNIAGDTVDEFGEMARMLDGVPGVAGIELNISCPNVDIGGMEIGQDVGASARATRAAVRNTDLPVIVKLTPNVTDPVALADGVARPALAEEAAQFARGWARWRAAGPLDLHACRDPAAGGPFDARLGSLADDFAFRRRILHAEFADGVAGSGEH